MKSSILLILFSSLLILSCNKKPDYEGKAIVLLTGEIGLTANKRNVAVIAYKTITDSVKIQKIHLPRFESPILVGDSLEIVVNENNIGCRKLFSYRSKWSDPIVFKANNRQALFHNGILTFGNGSFPDQINSLEFYNYRISESENLIEVRPLGFPEEIAFKFKGTLEADSLQVIGYNDHYIKEK